MAAVAPSGSDPLSWPPQISRVLPGVALLLGFADTDDGGEAGAPGRFGLLPNQRVALAVIGAPLGMADNDGAGAGIRQHFG